MADDTFRMNPVSLGGLVGGVVAFIAVGAITAVLWVAIGVTVGCGVGMLVRRYGHNLRRYAVTSELEHELGDTTRSDLYKQAQDLDIPGRSGMTRDELAHALAERNS